MDDSEGASRSKAITRAQLGIVQVLAGIGAARGTGFLVSDNLVCTANHVIQGVDAKDLCVGFAMQNSERMRANFTLCRCVAVYTNADRDIALLRIASTAQQIADLFENPLGCIPLILSKERPMDGDPVSISGYPLGEAVLITNSGWLASVWGSYDSSCDDYYLADVDCNLGNSGGPVYRLQDAHVIGMCVAYKGAPILDAKRNAMPGVMSARLSIVVPSRYVIEALEKAKSSS